MPVDVRSRVHATSEVFLYFSANISSKLFLHRFCLNVRENKISIH